MDLFLPPMVLNKKIIWYVLVSVAIFTGFLTIKWLIFLFTYAKHEGYTEVVFGYPIPFHYALFYFLYWFTAFLGAVLLLNFKNMGWYVLNAATISGFIYLVIAVIVSLYSKIPINYAVYFPLIIGCVVLIWFLKKMIHFLNINQNAESYILPSLGVIIIGVVAGYLFGVILL